MNTKRAPKSPATIATQSSGPRTATANGISMERNLAPLAGLGKLKPILVIALLCNLETMSISSVNCQNATTPGSPLEQLSNYLSQGSIVAEDSGCVAHKQQPQQQQQQQQHQAVSAGGFGSLAENTNHQQLASLSSSMLKTYIRTNNMRAYHLDLHSYRREAKFVGDPSFIDSENPAHKQRCLRHLKQYEAALQSFKEFDPILARNSPEAMRLADVYGRPQSGVLSGNQFWLGDYSNCLDVKIKSNEGASHSDDESAEKTQTINSQYCIGVAQFPNWNPLDGRTSIKVGLCLPETCTSSMLSDDSATLEQVETMMKYQFGSGQPYERLKLRQVYCLPHKTSQIRQYSRSAIYFFALIGAFVATSVIATIIDYFNQRLAEQNVIEPKRRTWRTVVIESFSLTRNLEKFLRVPAGTSKQQVVAPIQAINDNTDEQIVTTSYDRDTFLNSITGIKCIGLIWIVCAHTFLVTPIGENNLIDLDKLTKTFLADIYLTAHLMVDTFFALSGLLASYFLFRNGMDKMKTVHWITLTIHRYWRLTPIYLLCYWFTKSVGFLVNDGPLWDYMTAEQSPRLNCNSESWMEALLHMSDFKSPKDHCVPFAWFIANGIKFWMVTPFFLVLIHKSMRRGYMTTAATIVANIILVAVLALKSNVDIRSVIEFRPESADNMLNNMGQVYTRPYSRIGAYLIGLLAGHVMYLIDAGKLEIKLSKNVKIAAWTIFSVTVILLTFVLKIANSVELDEPSMVWIFSISSAIIRPLWSLCSCWLVFAMAHGQVKWLSNFLTANFWRILVKLSFCAYLAQGEVIAQLYLAKSQSESFNYADMISRPIVANVMTIFVSFLMVILLEYPLCGIEELILPRHNKSPETGKEKLIDQSESSKVLGNKLKSA